jgi:hypothetical protein
MSIGVSFFVNIAAAICLSLFLYYGKRLFLSIKSIFQVPPFRNREKFFNTCEHSVFPEHLDTRKFGDIAEATFFSAITFSILSIYKNINGKIKLKTKKELSRTIRKIIEFYTNYTSKFEFTIISPLVENGSKRSSYVREIIDCLVVPLSTSGEPQLITLVGKIGCGKSALLSAIVNELLVKPAEIANGNRFLPLIIDVRREFKNELHEIVNSRDITETKIQYVLESKLITILRRRFRDNGISARGDGKSIDDVIKPVYEKLFNPIIILDELDVVYYQFCKTTLTPNSISQKQIDSFASIVKFFVCFPEDRASRGVYNSVLFMISLRRTSYQLFENVNLNGAQLGGPAHHSIDLDVSDSVQLKKIFTQRLKFKMTFLDTAGPEYEEARANTKNTIRDLESSTIDYSENLQFSVHGTRHLMNLFHKVDYHDPSGKLLQQYLTEPNDVLTIFQFLDGSLDYSQVNEGVTNIFLVNSNYSKSISEQENNPLKDRIDRKYFSEHIQTYFLKYFVHYYIYLSNRKFNDPPSLRKLKEVFSSGTAENKYTFFEQSTLSLMLLHSTETDHGRLVRIETGLSGAEVRFRSTNRAVKMFEANLFWSFKYLMVVIEDNWLEFPSEVSSLFKVREEWQRSYHFVTNLHLMHEDEKLRFILYKSRLVVLFLRILQVALEYERKRYQCAFENMKRSLKENYIELIIPHKRSEILVSIRNFSENLLLSDNNQVKIYQYLNSLELRDEERDMHEKANKTFYRYHGGLNINSINNSMRNYHSNAKL